MKPIIARIADVEKESMPAPHTYEDGFRQGRLYAMNHQLGIAFKEPLRQYHDGLISAHELLNKLIYIADTTE